jgi:hypothetical protein
MKLTLAPSQHDTAETLRSKCRSPHVNTSPGWLDLTIVELPQGHIRIKALQILVLRTDLF